MRQADAKGCLEIAKKWQELNLDKVSQELDVLESLFQKMTHLKENYPSLAKIVLLRQLGSSTKVLNIKSGAGSLNKTLFTISGMSMDTYSHFLIKREQLVK